ncbi:unnamed protein product [Dicrocoelium dendriticum]|nr:unnamed protein product [Dicrocoelium dendriticum]
MPSPLFLNLDGSSSSSARASQSFSSYTPHKPPFDRPGVGPFSPINLTCAMRTRSHSLSPLRSSAGGDQDILLLNDVYRERFPKASAQMQGRLQRLVEELDHMDTVSWSAVARFVHRQVIQHAKDCLQKALSRLVTCRYFYEMTENLNKLVEDTRVREPDSIPIVVGLIRRLLLIIARPARLLECLEFDPREFYQMLEVAEDEARKHVIPNSGHERGEVVSADVPLYIISKLGLNKTVATQESYTANTDSDVARDLPVDLGHPSHHSSSPDSSRADDVSRAASIKSGTSTRPPCEADFELIKLVSNGAYGAVYLVRHRATRQRFAMKKIRKQHLQLRNQVEQVFAERDIMSFADNPFVVSLCCTFETKKCLCIVVEYVEGGDCAKLLKQIGGPLPLDLARLYFAETVLALEYLHNYGIVHRDLKPDNLLITHEGHIKLTDFGLSRIGLMNLATNLYEKNLDMDKDCKMFRDKQVFGTPEYIAPEVILRQGYGKPVDWWSMGIILYEFLVGCVPFSGCSIEDLFGQIVNAPIEWPEEEEWRVPDEAVEIITMLLERAPLMRLSTAYGATEVEEADFFAGPPPVDWNNLLRQKAAFVPQLSHDEYTSYFDPRTDRFQHDIRSDEDIDYPYGSMVDSDQSSPLLPSSSETRASGADATASNRANRVRKPAASRLSREKRQQTKVKRRCRSLGETAPASSRSETSQSRSPSHHTAVFSHNASQEEPGSCPSFANSFPNTTTPLLAPPTEARDAELTITTSSMAAESAVHRSALNMLQHLTIDSHVDSKKRDHITVGSISPSQLSHRASFVHPLRDASAESDTDSDENKPDTETVFHSFTSYSPRFSVVLEQARLNELAVPPLPGGGRKSSVNTDDIRNGIERRCSLDSATRVQPSPSLTSASLTSARSILDAPILMKPSGESVPTVTRPVDQFDSGSRKSLLGEESTATPIKHVSAPRIPDERHDQPTPISDEFEKLLSKSSSTTGVELGQHASQPCPSISSSSDLEATCPWPLHSWCSVSQIDRESPAKIQLIDASGSSDQSSIQTSNSEADSSSSSSSLSLTPLTAPFMPMSSFSTNHMDPSVHNVSAAVSTMAFVPLVSASVKSPSGYLIQHSQWESWATGDTRHEPSFHSRTDFETRAKSSASNSSDASSNLCLVPNSRDRSPGAVVIPRGKSGYGFTIRAIRVFFGTSNRYTLHHLVHSVDPDGPAFRAGLKEGYLITSINNVPTPGMLHTQLVRLLLQNIPEIRLQILPIQQSHIRSDGPWRPAGKLISRTRATPHTSTTTSTVPTVTSDRNTSSSNRSPQLVTDVRNICTSSTQPSTPLQIAKSTMVYSNPPSRTVHRRLTIRETRHRNLPASSTIHAGHDVSLIGHARSDAPSLPSPTSQPPSLTTLAVDQTRTLFFQPTSHPVVTKSSASQTYNLMMSQRFGLPINNHFAPNTSLTGTHLHSAHRRSIEKPLLRQLSERQHRAMLAAHSGAPANPTISMSTYVGQPSTSTHCVPNHSPTKCSLHSPRFDYAQPQSHQYSTSPSTSHTIPLGSIVRCYPSVDVNAHAPPYDVAAHHRPAALHFPEAASPRTTPQVADESSYIVSSSRSAYPPAYAQIRLPPNPHFTTTTSLTCSGSAFGQTASFHALSPSPIEPAFRNVGCRVATTSSPTSVPFGSLSSQANALVSSGQVRLRRRSHTFAVHHVASPNSPLPDSDGIREGGDAASFHPPI